MRLVPGQWGTPTFLFTNNFGTLCPFLCLSVNCFKMQSVKIVSYFPPPDLSPSSPFSEGTHFGFFVSDTTHPDLSFIGLFFFSRRFPLMDIGCFFPSTSSFQLWTPVTASIFLGLMAPRFFYFFIFFFPWSSQHFFLQNISIHFLFFDFFFFYSGPAHPLSFCPRFLFFCCCPFLSQENLIFFPTPKGAAYAPL